MRTSLRLLVIVATALVGLAFVPVPTANAAPPPGPTAVAVAPNGITYVGFAAGGSLTRVDASGSVLSPIPLPRSGPVDGIAVDGSGNLWVSYGSGASRITPAGAELSYFAYAGVPASCPATDADDPSQYGGIAVSPEYVYVANRCGPAGIQRYTLAGQQVGGLGVGARIRDIEWIPAQSGVAPARIFFSAPDQGKVYEYPEVWANNGGLPRFVLNMPQAGPNAPRPSAIAVDKFGQLAVSDVANSYILLFDTNNRNGPNSYSWYRTLGRPGSNAGDLNNATALAQYPVDGPLQDRRGDFFIGDTGNNRIQRWNTSGFTYWVASTNGGGSTPSAPVNTARPQISGTPSVGSTLTCSNGEWSGNPTSFVYGWNRNGSAIGGQNANTYVVQSGDAGQNISCFVRASNAAGQSDFATSDNVTINQAPAAPANTALPVISGTAEQGQTLTCSNGTWSGSPTSFTRVWQRNGTAIPGATGTTYVVQAADVGQAITCRVTATNAQGSGTATSAPVTPSAPTPNCGSPTGVTINNGAGFTTTEAVTLRIRPKAGATAVMISNDGGFDGASFQALSGTCTYAWALRLTGNDRTAKSVYVRFRGPGIDEDQTFSDDIVLDRTASPGAVNISPRARGRYVVNVRAADYGSGVKAVQFAYNRARPSRPSPLRTRFVTRKPANFTYMRVIDRAGNISAWRKAVRTR